MFNKSIAASLLFLVLCLTSCDKTDDPPIIEDRSDWMSNLITDYIDQDIALTDICVPASHDAGTYIFLGCSIGANACNTRTQNLNFTDQLQAGIRIFDVRPVLAPNGKYFTQHVFGCDGPGCKGDLIQNLLDQVKAFVDVHNELVILGLNTFCATGADDVALTSMISSTLGDRLFTDNTTESLDFINTPLKEIIPPGNTKGKVLVTYQGATNSMANRSQGIFPQSFLPMSGRYANAQDYTTMKTDQLQRFNSFSGSNNSLFGLSWTLTMNESMVVPCAFDPNATSIQDLANSVNINLENDMNTWQSDGTMSPGKIVNVLWADYVTHEVTDVCLDITHFNLE